MELSRRDALRAGGGLVAGAALAGCVEERVTRERTNVESSTTWGLEAGDETLGESAFEEYVAEMADIYDEAGVWGRGSAPEATFETAHVQRLPVTRSSSGQPDGAQPSLNPDDIDRADDYPVVDAAVSIYRTDGGGRQYWLWAAVDVRNETFARDADATVLSSGVSVRGGEVTSTASVTAEDGTATVEFGDGETGLQFPLSDGSVETGDQTAVDGYYFVEWNGSVGDVQSLNGAFEVDREESHAFRWSVGGGYTFERQV